MPEVIDLAVTTTLEDKTRELCQFVLDLPSFREAWEQVEAFANDDKAQAVYRNWQELGQEFQQKEHQGIAPTAAEVENLEDRKQAVLQNPVAFQFACGEESINEIFATVTRMLQKTLQNGRIPSAEEMQESGCCGGGCGCDN